MWIEWVASILAMVAALAAAVIGSIVWFGERTNRLRITFLWLSIFVAAWITSNVVFAIGPEAYRWPVALISYAAALFVATQTFNFALKLVHQRSHRVARMFVILGYIAAIISAVPGVVGLEVSGAAIVTRGEGILFYGLLVIGYLLAACTVLILSRRHANKILRRQVKLVMYGVIMASIVGVAFNLILPIMGNYSLIQLGPAGATIFVAMIAYAVARYSLFDVRLAIVRVVAYIATFTTLAGIYFALAYVVALGLNSPLLSPDQMALNIIAALVMALLLQPIKKFFDKLTDKVFYRDNYNTDEFFAEVNRTLSSTSELRTLLASTSRSIAQNLKSEQVFFFVYSDEKHYVSAGTEGHITLPLRDARQLDDYIGEGHTGVIQGSMLEHGEPIKRLMVSHKIELLLPLLHDQHIIGYVCLGDKQSGGYTRRDLRLLGTIADEMLIAIQNALAVQQVKELNETLQQRINEATRELRASNAQLQRLDEAKDEFISMASHQLRTPLTSIKGYISMLMEGDVGKVSPDQKHLLQEAFVSSERMVRLIGDFLNVSRLQTGKFVIEKQPVDLAKLVGREIESLGPNASARNLTFEYKQPRNFPMLSLDESKIQQVIMNFADNALYYSKEKTTIKVSLAVVKDRVEFKVKDTGIGVPLGEQDNLFSKFYRATNARKQRPDGTGVGLFLAKKVIDAHDGKVVFESKENKGSTFGFSLPLSKLRVGDTN
jgi:signal transduction histidine kinase